MRVPANISGDKLITDYLARVTVAGLRLLPKGDRMAFVGRTRALIARECGPGGPADPLRVREVLTALGEPEELVRQERARLAAEWARRRARREGQAGAAGERGNPSPAPGTASTAPGTGPLLDDTIPFLRLPGSWPGDQPGDRPGEPGGAGAEGSPGPQPSPRAGRLEALAHRAAALARRHPVESAAAVLLGIAGAILPYPPIWLLGGVLAALSRLFDARDTWLALVGPPVIVLVLTGVAAPFIGGDGNPAAVYLHALSLDMTYLLRPACVACAGYLAWRIPRGRRVRVPPWQR